MSGARPRMRERAVRSLALLALYMLDARSASDSTEIRAWCQAADGLDIADDDVVSPSASRMDDRWREVDRAVVALVSADRDEAFDLALGAHRDRRRADADSTEHAPHWPAHRQPAMDRAILRLGHYELAQARADRRIVINEAVEFAKRYCSDRSPGFINAILDHVARDLASAPGDATDATNDGTPTPASQGDSA